MTEKLAHDLIKEFTPDVPLADYDARLTSFLKTLREIDKDWPVVKVETDKVNWAFFEQVQSRAKTLMIGSYDDAITPDEFTMQKQRDLSAQMHAVAQLILEESTGPLTKGHANKYVYAFVRIIMEAENKQSFRAEEQQRGLFYEYTRTVLNKLQASLKPETPVNHAIKNLEKATKALIYLSHFGPFAATAEREVTYKFAANEHSLMEYVHGPTPSACGTGGTCGFGGTCSADRAVKVSS